MMMLSLEIPKELEKDLDFLAQKLGLSKSALVVEAIALYLDNVEGSEIVLEKLNESDEEENIYSFEEAKRKLDLDED